MLAKTFRSYLFSAIAVLLFATEVAAADYTFQNAGAVFGNLKDHFGRANAWGDLNGDGVWDLITGSDGRGLRAFHQVSPLQFQRVDLTNGLATGTALYGILILDFDRDGDNDVFLNQVGFSKEVVPSSTRYFTNNGAGTFFEVTRSAGVESYGYGFGLVAIDYDRDGWIDVYVVNHESGNRLFHNLGTGSFEDVTVTAGVDALNGRAGRSTSAGAIDYDQDGWMDLYVGQRDNIDEVHSVGNSQLLRNLGDGTFVNMALEAGVEGIGDDFVVTVEDLDNDLWPDLYVSTFNFGPNGFPETNHPNRMYLNNRDGTFTDVTATSGADYVGGTMGSGAFDHDNDGLADLYIGTGGPFVHQIEPQMFYRNLGGGVFNEETARVGLTDDARGHGNSMLDVDRDGDLDIFASLGGHTPESGRQDILYLNSGGPRHWLEIQLEGVDCPLEGLGAVVTLESGATRLRRVVRVSGGFDSQAVPHVWFGLADLTTIDRLLIRWPCGRTEVVTAPGIDQHLQIREGQYPLSLGDETDEGALPLSIDSRLSLRVASNPSRGIVRMVALVSDSRAKTTLTIFDVKGRKVREYVIEDITDQAITQIWDGTDRVGRSVASGRYCLELRNDGYVAHSSVVLLR